MTVGVAFTVFELNFGDEMFDVLCYASGNKRQGSGGDCKSDAENKENYVIYLNIIAVRKTVPEDGSSTSSTR